MAAVWAEMSLVSRDVVASCYELPPLAPALAAPEILQKQLPRSSPEAEVFWCWAKKPYVNSCHALLSSKGYQLIPYNMNHLFSACKLLEIGALFAVHA